MPLQTIFTSKEQALQFINNYNVGKWSHNAANQVICISFTRDRTLLERQEIRRLYAELEVRKNSGEHNIIVKYINGIGTIVFSIHEFHVDNHSTCHPTMLEKTKLSGVSIHRCGPPTYLSIHLHTVISMNFLVLALSIFFEFVNIYSAPFVAYVKHNFCNLNLNLKIFN